jgi:hypothetical protein
MLSIGLGGAGLSHAEVVTWTRAVAAANSSAVVTPEPAGSSSKVLFVRVRPSDPTPQEKAAQAALAQAQETQRATLEKLAEYRTYAELQAKLAQVKAEKEALMIAQNQVAQATAATEARLREETRRELVHANEKSNLMQTNTLEALKAQTVITGMKLEALREDTNQQLASYVSAVSSSVQNIAANQQQLAGIAKAVSSKVNEISANQEQLASYASAVSSSVQEIATQQQQQTALIEAKAAAISNSMVTPAQVEAIAANTLEEATPQIQAVAVDTLRNAKGYIRTVARGAVADESDPAMQQALESAASRVLSSDGKVAFAIRRAVLTELDNVTQGAISTTQTPVAEARTRLGDVAAIAPSAGGQPIIGEGLATAQAPSKVEEEALDSTRLRLARLLTPQMQPTTPADNPTGAATLSPAYGNGTASLSRSKRRTDLMNIRQYRVVVHEDQQTIPDMLNKIVSRAAPFAGEWEIKWKISEENKDILTEKFSLDAETTFEDFVSYLAQYLLNDRGVKISFSLFDRERVMLVSD